MSGSPFKFLDPYTSIDRASFFGRDRETDELYRLLLQGRLTLVYGPSGTGKTSLIQCGVASRFRDIDWLPLFVRRKDDLTNAVNDALAAVGRTPIPAGASLTDAVQSVFLDFLRPVFLILDQFEELLILGSAQEQSRFFAQLATLLASDVSCKVIISMREEYFAALSSYERLMPDLLDRRLRVEPMTQAALSDVIQRLTAAFGIMLEHGQATADLIVARLGGAGDRDTFQLPYLQVYLDRLYQLASAKGGDGIAFTDALIGRAGQLDAVIADLLDGQTMRAQSILVARNPITPANAAVTILEALVSDEGTRLTATTAAIATEAQDLTADAVQRALESFETGRIVRCGEDGLYELAHDGLARIVDDRRSADSKALQRIRKIVRDRLGTRDQVKSSWLSEEELALIRPTLPKLGLNPNETAFVNASRARIRRGRLIGGAIAAVIIVALSALTIMAWASERRAIRSERQARRTIAAANDGLNALTGNIYSELRALPQTDEARADMIALSQSLNRALVAGIPAAEERQLFWRTIYKGDLKRDAGDAAGGRRDFLTAVRLAETVSASEPADPAWRANMAVALERASRRSPQERDAGTDRAALSLMNRALKLARDLAAESPNDPEKIQLLGRMLFLTARLERDTNEGGDDRALASALAHFAAADSLYRRLIAQGHRQTVRSDFAIMQGIWGNTLTAHIDFDKPPEIVVRSIADARAHYRIGSYFYRQLLQEQSVNVLWRANLASNYHDLAWLELHEDEPTAQSLCRAAVAELRTVISFNPIGPGPKAKLAARKRDEDNLRYYRECHGIGLG